MQYKEAKYFEKLWKLQDVQNLSKVYTSGPYIAQYKNNAAVLKIIKPESDEQNSPAILRYFDAEGAVKLLKSEDNALLLEYLDPEPELRNMVARGEDDQATKIIADVIKKLHSPRALTFPKNARNLREHFRALFEKAQITPNSIYGRAAQVASKLLSEEKDIRLLHGDIHHENILRSKRGWLAIDPKGIIGERTYDVANTLCNPDNLSDIVHHPERILRQADILASELDMDKYRILAFAYTHSCISMCWSIENGRDTSYAMKSFEILESLIVS